MKRFRKQKEIFRLSTAKEGNTKMGKNNLDYEYIWGLIVFISTLGYFTLMCVIALGDYSMEIFVLGLFSCTSVFVISLCVCSAVLYKIELWMETKSEGEE